MRHFSCRCCLAVLLLFVLSLGVFASIPQVQASTVVEKFPTSTTQIVLGWADPTNAYVLDGATTLCDTVPNAEQEYNGFGFTVPSNATIDKATVKIKWATTISLTNLIFEGAVEVYLKVYNGSTWTEYGTGLIYGMINTLHDDDLVYVAEGAPYPELSMFALNVTSVLNTPTKINNAKLRILAVEVITPIAYVIEVDAVSIEAVYTIPTPTPPSYDAKSAMGGFLMLGLPLFTIALALRKRDLDQAEQERQNQLIEQTEGETEP